MIGDATSAALHAALSGLAQRQRVTADNIANINTPGFLAGRVDFESSLQGRPRATARRPRVNGGTRRPLARADQHQRQQRQPRQETVIATETGLRYQLALNALDGKYNVLRTSLQDAVTGRLRHARHLRRPGCMVAPQVAGRRLGQHRPTSTRSTRTTRRRSRSGSSTPRPSTTAPATGGVRVATASSSAAARGPRRLRARPPAGRRGRLRPLPRHRPGRPDGPADHGAARLPGEPRRRRAGHQRLPGRPAAREGLTMTSPLGGILPVGIGARHRRGRRDRPASPQAQDADGFASVLASSLRPAPGRAARPPTPWPPRPPPAT